MTFKTNNQKANSIAAADIGHKAPAVCLVQKHEMKINCTNNHPHIPSPTETAIRKPVALENARISQLDLIQFISSKFHSQEKNLKVALFRA